MIPPDNSQPLPGAALATVGCSQSHRGAEISVVETRTTSDISDRLHRPLRLAFLSAGANPFMEPYLEFAKSRGHSVCFFAFGQPIVTTTDVQIYDVSYGAKSRSSFTKGKYFLAPLRLRRLLKKIKPDILHAHYVTSAGVIALLSGFRPFIISGRGSDLLTSSQHWPWPTVLRRVFQKSALVHTVSEELSQIVMDLGVPHDKILTLTQGVDTETFAYESRAAVASPVRLLCTRSLREHPYRNSDILDACRLLSLRGVDFRLTFAAAGPDQDALKRDAARMDILSKVNFLGGYHNSVLPQIMNTHDLYVSASLWDGTSISLLEAMSSGLFPIVSRTNSNCSWIREDQTGLMFECGQSQELADKIIKAISDDRLFSTAIDTNRLLIREKADRQKNMRLLESSYYGILESKGLP